MALIIDPRMTESDLRAWQRLEAYDARLASSPKLTYKINQAMDVVRYFFATDQSGYVGVSWGKDSIVVADLVMRARPETPLVWARTVPHYNPDCERVRDAFFAMWPNAAYHEIDVPRTYDEHGWHPVIELDIALAERGSRYVSGVRAEESGARQMTMMRNGTATDRTCRPIGWWSVLDVFAYLHRYDLPVHPAYAFSMGGVIDRSHLRVAPLGGDRGTGHNRRHWEQMYYSHKIEEITRTWEDLTGRSAGKRFVL
jgi:phosphoadenosine phosphosulfate reductase